MPNPETIQQLVASEQYVFCVGRPDHKSLSVKHIHSLGYKAGIFADSQRSFGDQLNEYDVVIPVDFTSLESRIDGLASWRGRVRGLLCTYENYIVSKAQLGAYFDVPTLSVQAAKAATDKLIMRTAFAAKAPAISPAFQHIDTENDAINFANQYGYPVIIKPTNLVKSLLVTRCNTEQELRDTVKYTQQSLPDVYKKYGVFDHNPQIIIEEFITGPMYSIAGFVDKAGLLQVCPGATSLVSAQMIQKDDNYLYSRTLPAAIDKAIYAELVYATKEGVRAMGLTSTSIHAELIIGRTGIKIVEIGARIGGYRPRMYNLSYGIDLIDLSIRNALDIPLNINSNMPPQKTTSTYELFADSEGSFARISGPIDSIKKDSIYFSQKLQPGEPTGRAKDGHKAAAVIIQVADSASDDLRAAYPIKQIKIEVS